MLPQVERARADNRDDPRISLPGMSKAEDELDARLRVGRWLNGPMLSVAVALRELVAGLGSGGMFGDFDTVAPAWVVVTRKRDARVVGRLAAGREAGAGEHLLKAVQRDLASDTEAEFLSRYHLSR